MIQLLTLLLNWSAPVFATQPSAPSCAKPLGQGDEFVPTDGHLERLVKKIIENTGDPLEKRWHAVDAGNVGLHAYLIPHERAARFLDVATNMFRGQHWDGIRGEYDPRRNLLVGVLETNDEPKISVVILPKDLGEPMRRSKFALNPVDSSENAQMRKLVPEAWKTGHFESHHLLWDMLHDTREVKFPGANDHRGWTIEAYR